MLFCIRESCTFIRANGESVIIRLLAIALEGDAMLMKFVLIILIYLCHRGDGLSGKTTV